MQHVSQLKVKNSVKLVKTEEGIRGTCAGKSILLKVQGQMPTCFDQQHSVRHGIYFIYLFDRLYRSI